LVDGENIEEFNVKHISQEEYHELVLSENGIDKDTLYVVSSDTLNAYGEQIKNVAPGVENTDAVNVEQLSAVEQKIEKLNQLHDF
jgi:autotransporter adhesin